jgi:hypothetical protein
VPALPRLVLPGLILHAAAHVGANLLVALVVAAWRARGVPAWHHVWPVLWPMLASNVIDLDHLLADPLYDPGRCSIGFHPLHTTPAAAVYALGTLWRRSRWFAVGALTHLAVDWLDCAGMG